MAAMLFKKYDGSNAIKKCMMAAMPLLAPQSGSHSHAFRDFHPSHTQSTYSFSTSKPVYIQKHLSVQKHSIVIKTDKN